MLIIGHTSNTGPIWRNVTRCKQHIISAFELGKIYKISALRIFRLFLLLWSLLRRLVFEFHFNDHFMGEEDIRRKRSCDSSSVCLLVGSFSLTHYYCAIIVKIINLIVLDYEIFFLASSPPLFFGTHFSLRLRGFPSLPLLLSLSSMITRRNSRKRRSTAERLNE